MYPIDPKFKPRPPEIGPGDNILYFPNNVDVRLCPKNGMSTLKELYRRHFKLYDNVIGLTYRSDQVSRLSSSMHKPFRKGSFRIAVRRDPIDRFKSACEFIQSKRAWFIKHGRELPDLSTNVQEVIDAIEAEEVYDNHFYTQSYYMGHVDDYDMVVHINELPHMIDFLMQSCQLDVDGAHNIHENRTTAKLYNAALSSDQIDQLKRIYERDYENGWCKIEDRING